MGLVGGPPTEEVEDDTKKGLVVVHGNFGLVTFRNQAGGTPPARFKGSHTWSRELEKQFDAYNASR